MLLIDAPDKLVLPFADAGGKNTIPVASQIGITPGAASLTDGFPPLTRTPLAAGGVPPSGLDMNGVLFEMSAVIRWANAGGGYPFDGTFASDTNVGGYPKGARVLRSDGLGYWFNTIDDNVTDPEGVGAIAAGWVPDFAPGATAVTMTNANVTLTALQYGKPLIVITGLLTSALNLVFPDALPGQWMILNNTTGGYSITAKTASGTGVTVGAVQQIVSDGTNIVAPPSASASIQGAFKNLAASATGTSATVTVTADEVALEDGSNNYKTVRAVSLTISGAGSGANGLDTGSLSASTWYSVWIISNGSTTAGLLSLSATAPTMPAGYGYKARVGWIRTDASGNKYPLAFKQFGRQVRYLVAAGSNVANLPVAASGAVGNISSPTWVAVGMSNYVPTTASMVCLSGSSGGSGATMMAPNNSYGALASSSNPPPVIFSQNDAGVYSTGEANFVLESSNIYWASTLSSALIAVRGWEDNI